MPFNSKKALTAAVFLVSVLFPLAFLGHYAGDAQIHLIYAQNASLGHFFEFNLGEKSAGVTSVGYMLLLTALFKILPAFLVPAAVKVINLLFWYGLIYLCYRFCQQVIASHHIALLTTLLCALLPGSVYNGTIGMENGLFAFAAFAVVFFIGSKERFFHEAAVSQNVFLGILLAFAVSLRPEGFVLVALFLLYRIYVERRLGVLKIKSLQNFLLVLVPVVLVAATLLWLHHAHTGSFLPNSGKARIVIGHLESWQVGPFYISFKFVQRLVYYFPLTVFALWGTLNLLKAHKNDFLRLKSWDHGLSFGLLLFWAFFGAYSTVLGTAHLGRYAIFLMPFFVIAAGKTVAEIWSHPTKKFFYLPKPLVLSALLAVLLSVFGVETYLRYHLEPNDNFYSVINAPAKRQAISDEFYQKYAAQGVTLPISIAYQEVQIRYWLDERFTVRSLDGRVDEHLLKYVHDSHFDHIGYLKDRKIDYVREFVDYNKDSSQWSLKSLEALGVGEKLVQEGVTFEKIDPHVARVFYTGQ